MLLTILIIEAILFAVLLFTLGWSIGNEKGFSEGVYAAARLINRIREERHAKRN